MSRTLHDQLTALVAPPRADDAPEREKSELRRMADRAGINPSVKVSPEDAIGSMLGRWSEWYCAEMRKRAGQ